MGKENKERNITNVDLQNFIFFFALSIIMSFVPIISVIGFIDEAKTIECCNCINSTQIFYIVFGLVSASISLLLLFIALKYILSKEKQDDAI
jgi:uncharacterized membrane protein